MSRHGPSWHARRAAALVYVQQRGGWVPTPDVDTALGKGRGVARGYLEQLVAEGHLEREDRPTPTGGLPTAWWRARLDVEQEAVVPEPILWDTSALGAVARLMVQQAEQAAQDAADAMQDTLHVLNEAKAEYKAAKAAWNAALARVGRVSEAARVLLGEEDEPSPP